MKFEEVIFTQKYYKHKPTFLPTRATNRSAGYDFYLKDDVTIKPRVWTKEEDAYLIAHYQSFTAADIGRDINRTVRAVEMRAKMFREIGILQSKGYKNNGGRRK